MTEQNPFIIENVSDGSRHRRDDDDLSGRDRGEREMSAIVLKAQPNIATRLLAGVSVPDAPLISRAIDFARDQSEPTCLIMS